MSFGSRGPKRNSETVSLQFAKISHRNELTKKAWENATQGQGKAFSLFRCWAVRLQLLDVLA